MRRNEGFALVFVLTLALIVASLVSSVLQVTMSAARAAAANEDIIEADGLAGAVADLVLAFRLRHPAQQRVGAFHVEMARAQLDVSYRDEASRIDVNLAPAEMIGALAGAAGADSEVVSSLVTRIRRARPVAPGAAIGNTARLSDPVEIVGRFGISSSLAGRMLPALTAHGLETIDPLLALPGALSALFPGAPERISDFLEKRKLGFAVRDSVATLLPAETRKFIGFGPAPALRASVTVLLKTGLRRQYEAVFASTPEQSRAQIYAWHHIYGNKQ